MATPLEQYIRQAAAARGINPDIAVRVAKSEGGLQDPTRQSNAAKNGRREPSYGPFQLLIGGGSTGFPEGMGNAALRAGIDPRDPANAYRAIDFALDGAKNNGWGAWYGAKAQGITGKMGIGGNPVGAAPSLSPAAADFVKNNPQPGGFGLPVEQAAGLAPATAPQMQQPGGILSDPSIPQDVADYAASDEPRSLGDRLQGAFKILAGTPDAPMPRMGQMGDARQTGDALLKAVNAPKFAQHLYQKRMS
ncbi:hypothetical protein [Mesorhizobium sp.]|uniref:hypothetical protein n=1 Tax=Mesorhizobium sp. TaxID=1871066 RepID=UPI000FE8D3D5|nr:hypothetical protein [Mesorhizobium sp.]RWO22812.1 MAG: hypothetical protein EOS09_19270 [Mesorhizobium sp.]